MRQSIEPGGFLPTRHSLVHRTWKPSNIIFVNGVPKLADIGLVVDLSEVRSYVGTEGFRWAQGVLNFDGGNSENTNAALLVDPQYALLGSYSQTPGL